MLSDEHKEIYLLHKFSSLAYFEEFSQIFDAVVGGIEKALDYFYSHPPEGWEQWPRWKKPDVWRDRVLRNLREYRDGGYDADIGQDVEGIHTALQQARQGQTKGIRNWASCVSGLGRDMKDISDEWWGYLPDDVKFPQGKREHKLDIISINIKCTLDNRWQPGEILDEEITGPIDYNEHPAYLQGKENMPRRQSGTACPVAGYWIVEGYPGYGNRYELGEKFQTRLDGWRSWEIPPTDNADDQPVTWRMIKNDPLRGGETCQSGEVCPSHGQWMLTHVEGRSVDFVTREFKPGERFPEVEGKTATWRYLRSDPAVPE